jgi:hypothetical protein
LHASSACRLAAKARSASGSAGSGWFTKDIVVI